ncbi:GNAT family N-acetyltransferase [Pseudonocardia sp.]|uniref:GNAT family N-acetyltransferase n=1 Tax=Pseudonocardia sp. TaxID=60912 RepID=UPI003D12C450
MLPVPDAAALRSWFSPERPGPLLHAHVVATGHGRCRVDRPAGPRLVHAEVAGNHALRGDPDLLDGFPPDELTGFVEAPPEFLPALRALDPGVAVWDRIVAVLPDGADAAGATGTRAPVRRLSADDASALAALDPALVWISDTWGGPAGLAGTGRAWGAFDGGGLVSVAVPFWVGEDHEDIGVVTEAGYRGRGLSTACAAAVVADIRARGHRPTWTTSPDNAGSRAVADRLGFVRVREDMLYAVRTEIP